MDGVFTQKLIIPSYAVGADNRLRLSALLQLQQEAGERELSEIGLSYGELKEKGVAFLVTRLKSKISRLPQMGETVVLKTWQREIRGVQFFRCYTLVTEQGETLVDSVSAFALTDTGTHKLLRPTALDLSALSPCSEPNGCPDPGREEPPALVEVASIRPRWSELDPNGHVNNTRYADYLCDHLPSGMEKKRVRELYIRFDREVRPDDRLTLSAAEERFEQDGQTGGVAWVAGSHARGTAFVAKLGYEDEYERRF